MQKYISGYHPGLKKFVLEVTRRTV